MNGMGQNEMSEGGAVLFGLYCNMYDQSHVNVWEILVIILIHCILFSFFFELPRTLSRKKIGKQHIYCSYITYTLYIPS